MSIAAIVAAAFVAAEGGESLRLFQTTESRDFREIATSGFTIHPYPAVEALDVDSAKELHQFLALGASMTDASAWILANMPDEKRERLMRELFTPEGCNLGAIRLNMGASDYSTGLYSYDDTPGDVEMRDFSLARDDVHLVPMAKAAKALRPDVFTVDSATHDVTYSPQYRLFRHIGPFVKRGARVMEVEGSRDGTRLILFRNPGGEYVLVVACDGTLVRGIQRRRLVVKYRGKYKTLPLPGRQWSVSTLVFK